MDYASCPSCLVAVCDVLYCYKVSLCLHYLACLGTNENLVLELQTMWILEEYARILFNNSFWTWRKKIQSHLYKIVVTRTLFSLFFTSMFLCFKCILEGAGEMVQKELMLCTQDFQDSSLIPMPLPAPPPTPSNTARDGPQTPQKIQYKETYLGHQTTRCRDYFNLFILGEKLGKSHQIKGWSYEQ